MRCKACERYRDVVNAAVGRLQWERIRGDPDAIEEVEKRLAGFGVGWRKQRAICGCPE